MSEGISGSYTVLSAAMISSVNRATSASPSPDALPASVTGASGASRAATGAETCSADLSAADLVALLASSFMRKIPGSCEELLRLDQGMRKAVHLLAGVVERQRGPARGSHPEAGKERHDAMGARAYRDP